MADQSTINVRISTALKKRGDEVLVKAGGSPSQAIRTLWAEMARTRSVPDFILQDLREETQEERERKHSALRDLSSFASATDAQSDADLEDVLSRQLQKESEATS